MEIERKFLIHQLPEKLDTHDCKTIRQGYVSTSPVIRIRQLGQNYILTIKGKGLMSREEFELDLTKEEFGALKKKVDGLIINKTRYYLPYESYTIELDIFHDDYEGLVIAEVEFASVDEAERFTPPEWFGEDVTNQAKYHNSNLSKGIGL